MKNEAIVYEIVNPETLWRTFFIDNEDLAKMMAERFDREGMPYQVYRAKVAPLSHKRWAKFMSQLAGERAHEVPFFFNGELLVSSDQSVAERVRFWSGGDCHLKVVEGPAKPSNARRRRESGE